MRVRARCVQDTAPTSSRSTVALSVSRETLAFILILAALPLWAVAAPPDVKWLMPSGGQAGQTVEVRIGGALGAAPAQLWSDRPGLALEPPPEEGKPARLTIAADAAPGLYRVRFFNAEGASAVRPFFVGTAAEIADTEPNDGPKEPQSITALPTVVNGALAKRADVDVYAVELKQGQTLVASVVANEVLGSPMDAVLQLLSSDGFILEQNHDDRGLDPQLVWTAPQDGRYLIRLFAFPATPDSSIRLAGAAEYLYRLTLTTGPFLDHAVPAAVTHGRSTAVALRGWNLPADLAPQRVDAAGEPARIELHPPIAANAVSVTVESQPSLTEAEIRSAAAAPLSPPQSITGHIEQPREADVYRIAAKKGQKLRIRVQAGASGSPIDPVVQVIDAGGKVLQDNDDAGRRRQDAELTFAPPADGEYVVEIRDLNGTGSWRHVYQLEIGEPQPDFELTVKADAFTITPGKPLGIPVTIGRRGEFAAEIELIAEGLAEGVTAAAVRSEPKGATAKSATLVLTSTRSEPFSGPFRIVGRTLAEPAVRRIAESGSLAGRDLWLTAPAAK